MHRRRFVIEEDSMIAACSWFRSIVSDRFGALAISLSLLVLLLAAFTVLTVGCDKKKAPRNQVVLVTVDTTRKDHVIGSGRNRATTPNFDLFAGDAAVFNNCWSAVDTTIPSHTAILTSLYVKDHKVVNMSYNLPDFPEFLPKVFKEHGYSTAAFTSGGHLTPSINIDQGFDEFYYPDGKESVGDLTNSRVLEWLDRHRDEDFFIWVHYFDPHMVYDPPESYAKRYLDGLGDPLSSDKNYNESISNSRSAQGAVQEISRPLRQPGVLPRAL
jgi:membrane-anchored protein YejM (alkaline phosphatase superfamily)